MLRSTGSVRPSDLWDLHPTPEATACGTPPHPALPTPSTASEACSQHVQANLTWSHFRKRLAKGPKA